MSQLSAYGNCIHQAARMTNFVNTSGSDPENLENIRRVCEQKMGQQLARPSVYPLEVIGSHKGAFEVHRVKMTRDHFTNYSGTKHRWINQ